MLVSSKASIYYTAQICRLLLSGELVIQPVKKRSIYLLNPTTSIILHFWIISCVGKFAEHSFNFSSC